MVEGGLGMSLGAAERAHLRQQAWGRWRRSQELHGHSVGSRKRAGDVQTRAAAARERASEVIEHAAGLVQRSSTAATIDYLANRVVATWNPPQFDLHQLDQGAAIMASGSMYEMIRGKELLGEKVPYVLGATDAGTALGLVIASQPDVAIIDQRLELADGVDLALSLPAFAPHMKVLVLTDDPVRAADLDVVGLESRGHDASDALLRSWIEKAVA